MPSTTRLLLPAVILGATLLAGCTGGDGYWIQAANYAGEPVEVTINEDQYDTVCGFELDANPNPHPHAPSATPPDTDACWTGIEPGSMETSRRDGLTLRVEYLETERFDVHAAPMQQGAGGEVGPTANGVVISVEPDGQMRLDPSGKGEPPE